MDDKHKVNAMLGGFVLGYDMVAASMGSVDSYSKVSDVYQSLFANASLADFYRGLEFQPVKPSGSSDKSVAVAFRASYMTYLRFLYLNHVGFDYQNIDPNSLLFRCRENFTFPVMSFSLRDPTVPAYTSVPDEDGVYSGDASTEVVPLLLGAPAPARGHCDVCGFTVVLDGHGDRCRVQVAFTSDEMRAAWLGDAMHALDVRVLISNTALSIKNTTLVSQEYLSAVAQRRYLATMDESYEELSSRSNHTWSTKFEMLYYGSFRSKYLLWLQAELFSKFGTTPMSDVASVLINDYSLESIR